MSEQDNAEPSIEENNPNEAPGDEIALMADAFDLADTAIIISDEDLDPFTFDASKRRTTNSAGRRPDISLDEAYAKQLQEEEYARARNAARLSNPFRTANTAVTISARNLDPFAFDPEPYNKTEEFGSGFIGEREEDIAINPITVNPRDVSPVADDTRSDANTTPKGSWFGPRGRHGHVFRKPDLPIKTHRIRRRSASEYDFYNSPAPPATPAESIHLNRIRDSPTVHNPDSDGEEQDQATPLLFRRRNPHGLTTYIPVTEARRRRIHLDRFETAELMTMSEQGAREERAKRLTEERTGQLVKELSDALTDDEEDDVIMSMMDEEDYLEAGAADKAEHRNAVRPSVEAEARPTVREVGTDPRGREITPALGFSLDTSRKRRAQDPPVPPTPPPKARPASVQLTPVMRLDRLRTPEPEPKLGERTTFALKSDRPVESSQRVQAPKAVWDRDTSDSEDNALIPWGSSPEKERQRKERKQGEKKALKKKAKKYTLEDLHRMGKTANEEAEKPKPKHRSRKPDPNLIWNETLRESGDTRLRPTDESELGISRSSKLTGAQRFEEGGILTPQQLEDALAGLPVSNASTAQDDQARSSVSRDRIDSAQRPEWLLRKPDLEAASRLRAWRAPQPREVRQKKKPTIRLRFAGKPSSNQAESSAMAGRRSDTSNPSDQHRRGALADGPPPPAPIIGWRFANPRWIHYRLKPDGVGGRERYIRGRDMDDAWNDALETYQVQHEKKYRALLKYFGPLPDHRPNPYAREIVASELEYGKYITYLVSEIGNGEPAWIYADEMGPEWDQIIQSFCCALGSLRMHERLRNQTEYGNATRIRTSRRPKQKEPVVERTREWPRGVSPYSDEGHRLGLELPGMSRSLEDTRDVIDTSPEDRWLIHQLQREDGWEAELEDRVVRHDTPGAG